VSLSSTQKSDLKVNADVQALLFGPLVFGEALSSLKDFKKLIAANAITILVLDLTFKRPL
jgi:L-alanine-DL-glutamate epimerase-like enolase superfamily enzyme